MNGSFDTEMVSSIEIGERVGDDINDQAALEEDKHSDNEEQEQDTNLLDYSYGLDEMDILNMMNMMKTIMKTILMHWIVVIM